MAHDKDDDSTDVLDLTALVAELRQYLQSAENALAKGEPEWIKEEVERLRRTVRAWLNVDADKELAVRMHFTFGVDFYSQTGLTDPASAASQLIGRIHQIDPIAAGRMDPKLVENAIVTRWNARQQANKGNEPQWSWKSMIAAWGRHVPAETWRQDWFRARYGRYD